MNYYLVRGEVNITYYMGKTVTKDDIRLVRADNAESALLKYEEYWANKSSEYIVSYYASGYVEDTVE